MSWLNLNGKFEEKGLKIGFIILLFILIVFILIIGSIFSYKLYNNQYKRVFGLELKDSDKAIQPHSIVKENKKSVDTPIYNSPVTKRKKPLHKTIIIEHQASSPNSVDTSKNKPQFNFNNSPISNSAIGINPTVINNNGVKQRHLDSKAFENLLNQAKELYLKYPKYDKTKFDIGALTDAESYNLTKEIEAKLKERGFTVRISVISFPSYQPDDVFVMPGVSNWPLIVIGPAKNVN